MEKYLSSFGNYLVKAFLLTFNQLFVLFGPLLLLMVLLNFSARLLTRQSVRFWGSNLFLYGFAWLGCTVHELSHAFLALIFGHKIREIALFEPNKNGESLGHVSHSFNKKSFYQKTGNFFIGIGPLLADGILLFLMARVLFRFDFTDHPSMRITPGILTDFLLLKKFVSGIWVGMISFIALAFPCSGLMWWKSALLIYILYSVGSSMTLSKSDVSTAFSGFLWVILIFFLFNFFTLWIGDFAAVIQEKCTGYISGFYFLLIFSLLTNLLFIILLFVLNFIKSFFVGLLK